MVAGTQVECDGNGAGGTMRITAKTRTLTLRILGQPPASVTRDGQALPQAPAPRETGWRFDHPTGDIEIVLAHSGGTTTITD
jgi:hypothetical protein